MQTEMNNKKDIGTAIMAKDGTITLRLAAQSDAGIACGMAIYKTDDPDYQTVLSHLGKLMPGHPVVVKEFDL